MEEKENNIDSNVPTIDVEKLKTAIENICNAIKPVLEEFIKEFKEFWDRIDGNTLLFYRQAYEQSEWKYVKKGKKYIKVRRHNNEDISRAFSRKIKHYKKQIQRSIPLKRKN